MLRFDGMRILRSILALLALSRGALPAWADEAMWTKLREGGRVAPIRHAQTPGGAGDPAGFRLDDCGTQRNLSEQGRAQAVPVERIASSQWCRTLETARLLDLGPVEDAPTFNNAYVLSAERDRLTAGAREAIGAWLGRGTLIVVSHGANILPLTRIHPGEGEIVVVEPDPGSPDRLKVLGRIGLGP